MFYSIQELVEQAKDYSSVGELMIATEMELTDRTREEIIALMERNLEVMESSIEEGIQGVTSVTKITGGDAKRMNEYIESGKFMSGETILKAVRNGIAVNEVNAKMGLVCATPTAGSAGVLPGVLMAAREKLNLSHEEQIDFLFTAGAFGLVMANNASISGAEGGCQAEVGSASAMGAAAAVEVAGGSAEQSAQALSIAMSNLLGLVCDPIAGLVEVPCVKRNGIGAGNALIAADMALAGCTSVIPADECIEAMKKVGHQMPASLRETGIGGLAGTPTGQAIKAKIFGKDA